MNIIPIGLTYTKEILISNSLTVPQVSPLFTAFQQMPDVFATAYLIGFVEWTCMEAIHHYLEESEQTLGTHVNLSHSAATPVGMTVKAEVKLISIDKKKLTFEVCCKDAVNIICEGTHERHIIDQEKFMQKVRKKKDLLIKNIAPI